MKSQIEKELKEQKELLDDLTEAREQEVQSFLDFNRAQDDLSDTTRDCVMRIVTSPAYEKMVELAPGQEGWNKWVLENEMRNDDGFVQALQQVYDTQEDYTFKQAKAKNLKDALDAANIRINTLRIMV